MKLPTETIAAINKIPNKTDFCERYSIPIRTLYNLLTPGHSANQGTAMIVTMALQAEGLLAASKKARA